jgi:hypothetical protein
VDDRRNRADARRQPGALPNQVLSYIVFARDRARFERELPNLELVEMFPLSNYLRYLLSDGLNFRRLVPNFTEPVLRALKSILTPTRRMLALHHVVVLRRRASSAEG